MKVWCWSLLLVLFLDVVLARPDEYIYSIEINEVEQPPAPPTLPPSKNLLERYDMTWGKGRKPSGYHCIDLIEPKGPAGWLAPDNPFLCTKEDLGIQWSATGKLPDMDCTQILERGFTEQWRNNYICVPLQSDFRFIWSYACGIGMNCLKIDVAIDPEGWTENFLCPVLKTDYSKVDLGLQLVQGAAANVGAVCVALPYKHDTAWAKVRLCFNKNYGVSWSDAAAVPGMECTHIYEPTDTTKMWHWGFLCVPKDNAWHFHYDITAPIPGLKCIKFNGKSAAAFQDNYLCY